MSEIFVFGSNLAGRHGKGAALHAKKYYGAVYGDGVGRTGDSYAIPTKDENLQTLSLKDIRISVWAFLAYAGTNHEDVFRLTAIGCGLAGYEPYQIAPMFQGAPPNVIWPGEFLPWQK